MNKPVTWSMTITCWKCGISLIIRYKDLRTSISQMALDKPVIRMDINCYKCGSENSMEFEVDNYTSVRKK